MGKHGSRVFRCVAVLMLALGVAPLAQAQFPSMKFERGSLISPSTAQIYYGGSTTRSSSFTGVSGFEGRPPEIVELARALNNDPDQIFEYVRNHIEVEFSYGLRKGALGAIIDKSGTPFDQNVLFVELVRQAGYDAKYRIGAATFTQAQFISWTGISNITGQCQMLAFNGIPASINGSSPAACTGLSSGNVQIGHIWSEVKIGGTWYVFDPSFKTHTMVAQRSIASTGGLVTNAAVTQAQTSMTSGTQSSQAYISAVHNTNLDTYLTARSTALLNDLKTNAFSADMREVIGGRLINPVYEPVDGSGAPIGFRSTTVPYTASTVWQTIDEFSNIPDQYRTGMLVATLNNGFGNISRQLWVDEIYGRRLEFDSNFDADHVQTPGAYFDASLRLELDDVTLNEVTSICPTETWSPGCQLPGWFYDISLTINHPFAASSGAYADATMTGSGGAIPVAIMHGWGRVSPELGTKWGRERTKDKALPNKIAGGYNCDPEWMCTNQYQSPAGDMNRQQMGAAWLAQFSKMLSLQGEIGKSEIDQLHSVGFVQWTYTMQTYDSQPEVESPFDFGIADQLLTIHMTTSLGVASRENDAARVRAVSRAVATSGAMLEGSIVEQMQDLPDGSSTASRYGWGNLPTRTTADLEDVCSGAPRRRFYDFTGSSETTMLGLLKFEGLATGCTTTPGFTTGQANTTKQLYRNQMQNYLTAGFQVTGSEESFLGPGWRFGPKYHNCTSGDPICATYMPSMQRGGAFIATKYSGSEVTEVAHILGGLGAKGGGGAPPKQTASTYDPRKAADVLKDRFVDRSSTLGVDLKTGTVSYSTPALLSAGPAEGAPYKLETKLKFQAAPDICSPEFGPCLTGVQGGWTNNWDIKFSLSGSGLEAMGATSPMAATDAIVAAWVMQDIFFQSSLANIRKDTFAALTADWWRRRMIGNVATVTREFSGQQYIRQADNTWHAPTGAPGTLTQTGSRTKVRDLCFPGGVVATLPSSARRWDASAVTFKVRSAGGDELNFAPWAYTYSLDGCSKLYGYKPTTWTFPGKPTLTFSVPGPGGQVASVTSSLGHTMGTGSVTTSAGTRSIGGTGNNIIDPSGGTWTFEYVNEVPRTAAQRPIPFKQLYKVYEPSSASSAAVEYTYDSLGRTKQAKDGLAIQGQYGGYQFFIADGVRGQRLDPSGGRFTLYYDSRGNAVRNIDEINRITLSEYDGRHRVTKRTYPEGDSDAFTYDVKDNVLSVVKKAKPGSPLADITIVATWNATWNSLATLRDGNNNTTTFTYHNSGNGIGQLATVTRPQVRTPVQAMTGSGTTAPIYSFTYNSIGLVVQENDPDSRRTTHVYDSAGNRTSTTAGALAIAGYPSAGAPAYAALNLTTVFTPDAWGDVIAVTDPRSNTTTTIYDAMRRPVLVTTPDPDGGGPLVASKTVTKYDGNGQPHIQANLDTGSQWQAIVTERDILGRPTKVTRAKPLSLGTITTLAHVQALPLQTISGSDQFTLTTYDALGRVDIVADPENRRTKTTYDLAGQTLKVERAFGSTDAQDYQTNTWTKNGKLESVENAKDYVTNYTYDGFDRPKRVIYPDGTYFETVVYDANANPLETRTRANQAIVRSFDALDRLTRKSTPHRVETFAYELGGAQTCSEVWVSGSSVLTCGAGSPTTSRVVRAYDAQGRQTLDVQRVGGATYSVGYGYDAAGNATQIIWPDNWRAVYAFDPLNRLSSVAYDSDGNGSTDGTLALYAYNTLSRASAIRRGVATWGSGITATDLSWEPDGDLDTLTHTMAGETASFTYDFDKSGKVIADTKSANYAYAPTTASTINYSTGATASTTDKLDHYALAAGQVPTYDANGNRILLAGLTTTHDSENRLSSASKTGLAVSYFYDTSGRRVMKDFSSGGSDTIFVSARDMEIAEYSGTTLLRRFVPGAKVDDRVAMIEATGAISYYHTDRTGNIVAVTNGSGAVTDRYKYTPFGIETPLATSGNPYRYTGQRFDPETGLYQYRARYYDPSETGGGRFLEADPIGYKDQMNLYAYVGNDPLNVTDPSGLEGRTSFWDGLADGFSSYAAVIRWMDYREAPHLLPPDRKDIYTFIDRITSLGMEMVTEDPAAFASIMLYRQIDKGLEYNAGKIAASAGMSAMIPTQGVVATAAKMGANMTITLFGGVMHAGEKLYRDLKAAGIDPNSLPLNTLGVLGTLALQEARFSYDESTNRIYGVIESAETGSRIIRETTVFVELPKRQ